MRSISHLSTASSGPTVIQWLLDTRPLWPEAEKTSDLETVASRSLSLLSPPERASTLRYLHLRDAKMALASHLLKRYIIALHARVPWPSATATPNAKKKPVFLTPDGTEPVAFNVSHQAGMVALAAVAGYEGHVDVGVDVVSPTERRERDLKMIAEEGGRGRGWERFVGMHEDVFAVEEVEYLNSEELLEGLREGSDAMGFRLRCFYMLWCLREAYVKMTGEALLAEWLRLLEFKGFRPPDDARGTVEKFEIWFRGKKDEESRVCLRGLGEDYMVCTAVRTLERPEDALGWQLGAFEELVLDDILDFAESQQR